MNFYFDVMQLCLEPYCSKSQENTNICIKEPDMFAYFENVQGLFVPTQVIQTSSI